MPFFAGLFACVLILGYILLRSWRGSIHFLPSIGWQFLLVIPFFIEYPLFNPDVRDTQLIAIMAIAAALFAGDFMSDRIVARQGEAPAPNAQQSKTTFMLASGLAALFVGLSLWHLLTADSIPIFDMLRGVNDNAEQIEARNHFARDVSTPAIVRYACSFAPCIFAIPAVLVFIASRKYAAAGALMLWVVFYTVAGTAKSPLAMALLILPVGIILISTRRQATLIIRTLMVAGLAGLLLLGVLNVFSPYPALLDDLPAKYAHAQEKDSSELVPNLGDVERARSYDAATEPPFIWRRIDYILYRVFFTPVEVSERWFEYFHRFPVNSVVLSRMVDDSRSGEMVHPANLVGVWAFTERFPQNYTPEIYAYASIEADSYNRYGWLGLGIAALMLMGFRLCLAVFNDLHGPTHGAFFATGIALLSYLPSSASIQAILIPQGLGLLGLILFCLWMYPKMAR